MNALIYETATLAFYLVSRNCKLWLLKPYHIFRISVKTPQKEIPHFPAHISIADVIFNLEITKKECYTLRVCKHLFAQKAQKWIIFTCTEEGTGSISIENKSSPLKVYGIRIVIKYVLGIFVLPCVMTSFPSFLESTEILVPSLHIYVCVYIHIISFSF